MKSILVLSLFLLSITFSVRAQRPPEDEQRKARLLALQKDTAFQRFQKELKNIMKTSKAQKTNFASVRSLFVKNRGILEGLKKRYNVSGRPRNTISNNPITKSVATSTYALLNRNKNIVKTETFNPPYTARELYDQETGDLIPQQPVADDQLGKISWTFSIPPDLPTTNYYTSPYAYTFRQTILVPADPSIVSARVTFFYALYNTGWDTEGGAISFGLSVNASDNFNSPAYDDIGLYNIPNYVMMWRRLDKTWFSRSFDEIDDYSRTIDSSFSLHGFVTPGTVLEFKFGATYYAYCPSGDFGAYHHGQFTLKKITVAFLKAGD